MKRIEFDLIWDKNVTDGVCPNQNGGDYFVLGQVEPERHNVAVSIPSLSFMTSGAVKLEVVSLRNSGSVSLCVCVWD